MTSKRIESRREKMRLRIPMTIAEYPLEIALCLWGCLAWINVVTGTAPSKALSTLPSPMQRLWAMLMVLATMTVIAGLAWWRSTIGRGMWLFGATLISFAIAVLGVSGWRGGGGVGCLMIALGMVCAVRGWWLREQDAGLLRAQYQQISAEKAQQSSDVDHEGTEPTLKE